MSRIHNPRNPGEFVLIVGRGYIGVFDVNSGSGWHQFTGTAASQHTSAREGWQPKSGVEDQP